MIISKYNFVYQKNDKYFLFNTFSGVFFEIEKDLYSMLNNKEVGLLLSSKWSEELLANNIIIENDEDIIATLRLENILRRTDSSLLNLTIAPTMACNFSCEYCYEDLDMESLMSDETEVNLIEFVKNYDQIRSIHVQWYGGEPLLAFERIESLTRKIKEYSKSKNISFSADITTNGYLMGKHVIDQFANLSISKAQITLDGIKEVHDKRRHLVNKKGTFDTIYENISYLFKKYPEFQLDLRVNVDKTNKDEFHKLFHKMKSDFENSLGLNVYPGIVQNIDSCNVGGNCLMNKDEQIEFRLRQYSEFGIDLGYFPQERDNICVAQHINSFVVDPHGNLTKCWLDIGRATKSIGNINTKGLNSKILTRYLSACDSFSDINCLKCNVLPVCGGGCAYNRLENHFDGKNHIVCSSFKSFLEDHLEICKDIIEKK